MNALIKRNLKVFFRDKSAVFFSLLAVFIIVVLYILFIGDTWAKGMKDVENSRQLIDHWIMAGLLTVTSVSTTMGAFGTMINDRVKKISKDFYSSPIKRTSLSGGYIFSSFIIGVIMSLVALVIIEIYVVLGGGAFISLLTALKVFGLILLTSFTSTALVFFMVSFFKSQNAFDTASTIIGTLIGFLTGIYMPVGQLPSSMQVVIKVFPLSHSAALMRQVIMEEPLKKSFLNAPDTVQEDFELLMGVYFKFGDYTVSPLVSLLVLVLTGVVFYALATLNLMRKKN